MTAAAATANDVVMAAIRFDPHIRGALVVVTGVAVLMGSVYLILGTNLGSRLGFLVTLSALAGWMMLLSLFWWIYGVGAVGDLPEWQVDEINIGELGGAQLEEARELVPEAIPEPEDILAEHPEVADQFEAEDDPTISEIAALPDLPDEVRDQLEGLPGGWEVLPQTELGDAQTAADEALAAEDGGLYETTTDYVVLRGFNRGGKPDRASDGIWDRVANRVATTVRVLNPPHHAIVQVQTSESTEVPPGATPLVPAPDEDEPVVSVILVRDLGSLRLPPAMLTLFFGLLFGLCCWMLHTRDQRAQDLSQPEPTGG